MADALQTLALLNGKELALTQTKNLVDQVGLAIGALQVANAAAKAPVVASLQGLDSIGVYSSVDQLLRLERFAGKSASVDFIKGNPTCTEAEAEDSWTAAALAATGLPALVVPVASYAALYRANLAKAGLTPDATWESQRAWIVATDKTVIMGA
jgi:hypothetical protein